MKEHYPSYSLHSVRTGPLFEPRGYDDTKDPCAVHDGALWHIFGSRGSVRDERWRILHATAPTLMGPWTDIGPVALEGLQGEHIAAPGAIYDPEEGRFHIFVQTEFLAPGGTVEHLTSNDGQLFIREDTALASVPGTQEAGIYDAHPSVVGGRKYIVYSATPARDPHFRIEPDIHLAESATGSWKGPWKRIGAILDHASVEHHNQPHDPQYEWGLEGAQLIELPGGLVLLNAVCFLPEGRAGTRQRIFFAASRRVGGPYVTLGPVFNRNVEHWESGENGHAAGFIEGGFLYLFYQARPATSFDPRDNRWRYGLAQFEVAEIESLAAQVLGETREGQG